MLTDQSRLIGLDEIELPLYKAELALNDIMITHDDADNNTAEEWEPTVLDHKISKGLAGMPLRSIIFSFVYNDSAVTDQVLDMLSNLSFSE